MYAIRYIKLQKFYCRNFWFDLTGAEGLDIVCFFLWILELRSEGALIHYFAFLAKGRGLKGDNPATKTSQNRVKSQVPKSTLKLEYTKKEEREIVCIFLQVELT